MSAPIIDTYYAEAWDQTFHAVPIRGYADRVSMSAFNQNEVIHRWRVLDKGRYERERALNGSLGIESGEPVAHESVAAFMTAIGYDAKARALCGARKRALTRATRKASPDGKKMPWIDDKPYRVVLKPKGGA